MNLLSNGRSLTHFGSVIQLAAVKLKVRSTTHKYGVEIPTSVAHAQQLDEENKNTFWQDAIKKGMYQVSVAFEILDNGAKPPPG